MFPLSDWLHRVTTGTYCSSVVPAASVSALGPQGRAGRRGLQGTGLGGREISSGDPRSNFHTLGQASCRRVSEHCGWSTPHRRCCRSVDSGAGGGGGERHGGHDWGQVGKLGYWHWFDYKDLIHTFTWFIWRNYGYSDISGSNYGVTFDVHFANINLKCFHPCIFM